MTTCASFAIRCSAILGILASAPAPAEPFTLRHAPVALHAEDDSVRTVGALQFRGGLDLRSDEPRFGGISGLTISRDGKRLAAVTDKGNWIDLGLRYDRRGWLRAAYGIAIGRLDGTGPKGGGGPARGDAEALARYEGAVAVAFEGRHRIQIHHGSLAGRARTLAGPAELARAPENGGIEALTALGDGALLALSEKLAVDETTLRGWIGRDRSWRRLGYARTGRFVPTGAATLPGGDVLVLERRFTWIGGIASRIVRLKAAAIRPGARLVGAEIARIEAPLTTENFEGIAVRPGGNGELLIYLVSDDNFHSIQRTLLMMFALER